MFWLFRSIPHVRSFCAIVLISFINGAHNFSSAVFGSVHCQFPPRSNRTMQDPATVGHKPSGKQLQLMIGNWQQLAVEYRQVTGKRRGLHVNYQQGVPTLETREILLLNPEYTQALLLWAHLPRGGHGGGGVPSGHTPTPSHFPANFRGGGGAGSWGVWGRLKGRGVPGQHIWLKMTPSSR